MKKLLISVILTLMIFVSNSAVASTGAATLLSPKLYKQSPFTNVVDEIRKYFISFTTSQITKVETQIVSGMMYTVYFINNRDKYEIKAYLGLPVATTSKPVFQYVKKNGASLNLVNYQAAIPVIPNKNILLGGNQQAAAPNYSAAPYPRLFT